MATLERHIFAPAPPRLARGPYLIRTPLVAGTGGPPPDTMPPSVVYFPPVGSELQANTAISVEITDDRLLRRPILAVTYGNLGRSDFVYSGSQFMAPYTGTVETIEGGLRLTFSRTGGWPNSPAIRLVVADQSGNEVVSDAPYVLVGPASDTTPPHVEFVNAKNGTSLVVHFSEPVLMDESEHGALNLSNYRVDGLLLKRAIKQSEKSVRFVTSEQEAGRVYVLVVNNIHDLAGNEID